MLRHFNVGCRFWVSEYSWVEGRAQRAVLLCNLQSQRVQSKSTAQRLCIPNQPLRCFKRCRSASCSRIAAGGVSSHRHASSVLDVCIMLFCMSEPVPHLLLYF